MSPPEYSTYLYKYDVVLLEEKTNTRFAFIVLIYRFSRQALNSNTNVVSLFLQFTIVNYFKCFFNTLAHKRPKRNETKPSDKCEW